MAWVWLRNSKGEEIYINMSMIESMREEGGYTLLFTPENDGCYKVKEKMEEVIARTKLWLEESK